MWRNIGAKRKKKKTKPLRSSFCFCSDLCHKLGENKKAAWQGVMQIPGKSSAFYLSRPLTSKVFAKGPESRRHCGDIKRWQRWRPSTGPFSERIMDKQHWDTLSLFQISPASQFPPLSRLTAHQRPVFWSLTKFFLLLSVQSHVWLFPVFCLFIYFCFLSPSSVFYTILSGEINHGAVPLSHLSRLELHSHYVNSLPTISHKERGLRVMCTTPAGVDKR